MEEEKVLDKWSGAVGVHNGYIAPDVGFALGRLLDTCDFFTRVEFDSWLGRVRERGYIIRTLDEVPDDLLRLIRTGFYALPGDIGIDDEGNEHVGTYEEGGNPDEDDPADPFDDDADDTTPDSTASETSGIDQNLSTDMTTPQESLDEAVNSAEEDIADPVAAQSSDISANGESNGDGHGTS